MEDDDDEAQNFMHNQLMPRQRPVSPENEESSPDARLYNY